MAANDFLDCLMIISIARVNPNLTNSRNYIGTSFKRFKPYLG